MTTIPSTVVVVHDRDLIDSELRYSCPWAARMEFQPSGLKA